ncbi:hypothetical protein BUALT_Bualt03G0079700 [Buddleja alternifolia]|uniref:Stigma-specific STIG1-like protein 1 n=1 Tax=Buddleja alternifolia TaxID=168488 RepID=A0AAV6XS24_9LAMI|nr:hypothetical protein BUALT_Bualt03G0079700 [Buddleja alternifolia]
MKLLIKFIFLLAMTMALAVSHLAESAEVKPLYNDDEDFPLPENGGPTSLRGVSRFLVQKTRFSLTKCNNYPRVCRVKGSPGPDCCKKRCVNVAKDMLNCGKCGHKCKYSEICCKGKCINPLTDKKHCGGCNNKCKKGSKCVYGMCSYA